MFARKHGLNIWTVDVVRTETAKRSDKFFRIRPNTDVLFALGIARIIIENELYDTDFVKENAYGFDEFRDYVRKVDLNLVSEETGVGEERIEEFAFEYAEKKGSDSYRLWLPAFSGWRRSG